MHATYYHKASDQVSPGLGVLVGVQCAGVLMGSSPHACRAHPSLPYPPLPQLQVGVEFEASTRMQDTSASFGYQLDLPKANFLFKGKEGLGFPGEQL